MPADRALIGFSPAFVALLVVTSVLTGRERHVCRHIKGLEREKEPKMRLVNVKKGCYRCKKNNNKIVVQLNL